MISTVAPAGTMPWRFQSSLLGLGAGEELHHGNTSLFKSRIRLLGNEHTLNRGIIDKSTGIGRNTNLIGKALSGFGGIREIANHPGAIADHSHVFGEEVIGCILISAAVGIQGRAGLIKLLNLGNGIHHAGML